MRRILVAGQFLKKVRKEMATSVYIYRFKKKYFGCVQVTSLPRLKSEKEERFFILHIFPTLNVEERILRVDEIGDMVPIFYGSSNQVY